jgi:beta-lactam-binding protein with PASTA domain
VYVYGPVAFADTPPRKPCRVPRVVGLRLGAAKTLNRHRQCAVGAVRRVEAAERKLGRVVRQRPRPGTLLAHRARVDLAVGSSPR